MGGMASGAAAPGTARPGGRTSRVRAAVLDAALAVLAESGYTGLTMERIAERSKVNKSTIYRRWQSKEAVLAAALDEVASHEFPIPATGSIDGDLRTFGSGLVDFLTSDSPAVAGIVRALFSDAAQEPLIADLKREFFANRYEGAATMVDAAIARGELPADVDVRELVGLVAAPIYYRKLVTEEPLDHAVADRAVTTALAAVRAGLCRGQPR
ncbi:TetR/AcrR family transcriptional regulator [Mycobacterium seoulense]|uniref:TetR/AcrR family transcriptional regulator n=1 Tax=Mycobacterium seoulense TaxID=386911 RepID=UPI003CF18EBE